MNCQHEKTMTIGANVWCKICGNIISKPAEAKPVVEQVKVKEVSPVIATETEKKTKKKKNR